MADLGAIGFDIGFGQEEPIMIEFAAVAPVLPELTHTVSGVIRDDAGDPTARTVRAYRRSDGRLLSEATSDAGDGTYSLPTTDAEIYRVVLDDDAGTTYNDLIHRVVPGP